MILKALEKEPERRYQSAKELLLDLERLATPSAVKAAPERPRRRRWPVVVVAAHPVSATLRAAGYSWMLAACSPVIPSMTGRSICSSRCSLPCGSSR